jgi:hypothetical protein
MIRVVQSSAPVKPRQANKRYQEAQGGSSFNQSRTTDQHKPQSINILVDPPISSVVKKHAGGGGGVGGAPPIELNLQIDSPVKEVRGPEYENTIMSKTPKFGKFSTRRGSQIKKPGQRPAQQ